MRYLMAFLAALALIFALNLSAMAEENITPQPSPFAEPSPDPEPSLSPEPVKERTKLYIDNANLYADMTRTYSQGYIPTVKNGTAIVVLPVLCRGELRDNALRAKASFEPGGPFVTVNYEQTVEQKEHKVNGGKQKILGYCVTIPLQLREDRMNGSYPVNISVTALDTAGGEVKEDFTVYVNITDGKDPNATPTPEPLPTPEPEPPAVLGPKVLVQSCTAISLEAEAQPDTVNAGDSIRVTITLVNTSGSQALENMAVSAASPGEGFSLLSESDSVYIGGVAAGGTVQVIYDYRVSPDTPAGQYTIPLSFDFAYNNGETGSGTGSARVDVSQPLRLEFSMSRMPAEAVVSDVIEVNIQAINLSHAKVYNVRAVIEGDGLLPAGTAFIGDLEGGALGEKPLEVTVTGLTGGDTPYGPTEGTVTYVYEDGSGRELAETAGFILDVKSPFSEEGTAERDDPVQFWAALAGIGAALAALIAVLVLRAVRAHRA